MLQAAPALPVINPIYRMSLIKQLTGKSKSTLYREIGKNLFTKPIDIGGGRSGWPANEVQAIINARIAGKSDDEVKALVVKLEAARALLA